MPVNPAGHDPQVRAPAVFVQMVRVSQPPLVVAHSLMSTANDSIIMEGQRYQQRFHEFIPMQPVSPVPEYPAGQAPQVRDPAVFVQMVSELQPPLVVAHSFMSGDKFHKSDSCHVLNFHNIRRSHRHMKLQSSCSRLDMCRKSSLQAYWCSSSTYYNLHWRLRIH